MAMDYSLGYDDTNPISIEAHAKKLIGHTFEEVLKWNSHSEVKEDFAEIYGNVSRKGGLGNLLEREYFGYEPNSSPEPDFPKAGVELKVTPYERKKSGKLSAGERLVLGMISYESPIESDFYKSHAWQKCKLILLIYYLRNKELASNLLYPIDYATLFTPTEADLKIIEHDYEIIYEKIYSGRAHELSEGDTMYLGACTKGSTAEKSTVPQYYGEHIPARKRAFCFKNSYMTYVLNNYIVKNVKTYDNAESIIKDGEELKNTSFEDYVVSKIASFSGKSDEELCMIFEREYNNNKAQWSDLAYRILGIKSNRAEEFLKANIKVKAVRVEENGNIKESWPFPTFKYKQIITETWEESELYDELSETKYLLVVYKKKGDKYYLRGAKLWNMPYADIENEVRKVWKRTVDTIKNGIELTVTGNTVSNNLPGMKDNPVAHVRTHANQTYYDLGDGTIIGKGSRTRDANELPDGRWMTNHSFWINKSYLREQIFEYL